jgi:hypothetical protein
MLGFELWWAFEFNKRADHQRKQGDLLEEVCERWHIERAEAYKNRERVDSLLAPEMEACGGDLFALIERIQSCMKAPADRGAPVAEVELDTGQVTHLEGWTDALNVSLKKCGIDEHPASFLKIIIDAMKDHLSLLQSQRQALDKRISTLESELKKFRGRGRPKE